MEKFNQEKQPNRLEKIFEETARKAAEITVIKDPAARELWEKDDPKSREEFKKRTKELWKEFVTHGIVKFDQKEKKAKLLPYTDLDGKVSLGLLETAGFDISNIRYVSPGEFIPGAINIDTGFKTGIVVSEKDKTVWLDHHGEESTQTTMPAARLTYLTLVSLGFLEKSDVLDKLTQFSSRIDRGIYPGREKLFWKGDKTVLGLQRFFNFENLYDYFKRGKSPEEALSDEDLKKYGLEQRSKEQKKIIEQTQKILDGFLKDGFIINTKLGKIAMDIGKKLPSGYEGARAYGLDGYFMINPETESFFISINKANLEKLNLDQGFCIRKSMWIKPIDGEKLKVSIEEIIKKIGGRVARGSKLEKTINSLDSRLEEFIVTPKLSQDARGKNNWIVGERLFDKMALFPPGFQAALGKKYRVRVIGDTKLGERTGVYLLEVIDEK